MSDDQITVYTKPGCVQCVATMKALDKHGVDYRVIDVTADANALAHITGDLGYTSAPVVETPDGDHWSGYRRDALNDLASAAQAESATTSGEQGFVTAPDPKRQLAGVAAPYGEAEMSPPEAGLEM